MSPRCQLSPNQPAVSALMITAQQGVLGVTGSYSEVSQGNTRAKVTTAVVKESRVGLTHY